MRHQQTSRTAERLGDAAGTVNFNVLLNHRLARAGSLELQHGVAISELRLALGNETEREVLEVRIRA